MAVALGLRFSVMAIFTIIWAAIDEQVEDGTISDRTLDLYWVKMSVYQFSMPYYFFFMVSTSLLFSAYTFYIGIRDLFFINLQARDE